VMRCEPTILLSKILRGYDRPYWIRSGGCARVASSVRQNVYRLGYVNVTVNSVIVKITRHNIYGAIS